jgi:hypothetical protein
MKTKFIATMSVASLAMFFSACGGGAATNTNANKPANAATNVTKPANATTNANTTAPANTTANAATAPAADGDVVKIDEAGVMMTIPKGFKYSKDGEDIIVKTEDEGVDIRFSVPKDGDYDKAIMDAATEVDDYLKDVKVEDKGSKIKIDGMDATSMGGTATNEGEPVMWNLTIINAPKKPVLANIYAEKTSLDKHGAEVKKFLESVKKQ